MPSWKMGFEIELMAPAGTTRADLAAAVARRHRGHIRPFFHQQSEPSAVLGLPVFENLTPGFEVVDGAGARIATFVDDLTLQADCDKAAPPRAGWYRIVADDGRLLRLVQRHCDAAAPLEEVLAPIAALFGSAVETEGPMVRVGDDRGVSVAIGAPLPGERERPCEIVTAPLERDHEAVLSDLLRTAREMDFLIPVEGATHIHFDATPLQSAPTISRLVAVLSTHGEALKQLVGANPRCVRLGRWPEALVTLTATEAFRALAWQQARVALGQVGLTKYCDFNLLNIAAQNMTKHTFEVRILPSHLHAAPIIAAAGLFEALLRWCCDDDGGSAPETLAALIRALPLPESEARDWSARAAALAPDGAL